MDRIRSILACQELVFDSELYGLRTGAGLEYRALMDFDLDPSPEKAERLRSVVKAHTTLFGTGLIDKDRELLAEERSLLRYINRKAALGRKLNRSAILPRRLGAAFIRKGYGLPLFGYYRPKTPPEKAGFILCYQAVEADGLARFYASSTHSAKLKYEGLGLRIDSKGSWLRAAAVPDACSSAAAALALALPSGTVDRGDPLIEDLKTGERPLAETVQERFPVDTISRYSFHGHDLIISNKMRPLAEAESLMDPFHYRYAYWFLETGRLSAYLRNLWNGSFGLAERDAERAAEDFKRKLETFLS